MARAWILGLALLMSGCAAMRLAVQPIDAVLTDACVGGSALPAPLLKPGGLLIFGELHGTRELPAFFGEAVCWTSGALPVQAGLELPASEQERVETFLASPGAPADVEALTAGPFWSRPPEQQDGKASRAMAALVDRLRRLRRAGQPIDVFLFDVDDAGGPGERDRTMAERLAERVRAHPEALTLALAGNVHARKNKGVPWNPELEPMGLHLVTAGVRVLSLDSVTPAGTAWICDAKTMTCGSHDVQAWRALPSGRAVGIEMLAEPTQEGFDGLYATPSLNASPPARESARRAGRSR